VVPAGDAEALATGIIAQVQVASQTPKQIHLMAEESWESMMSAVLSYFPTNSLS